MTRSSIGGRSLAKTAMNRFVSGAEAEEREDYARHCRKFLDDHGADAADYAELNELLAEL